jgi:two-component system response regulator NreC
MHILLADDQRKVRSALRLLLEQEPDCIIIGEAADTTGLLRALAGQRFDLVFLDWDLPGLPGGEHLRLLRLGFPSVKIVVMSTDPKDEQEALALGAHAFASKVAAPRQILALIHTL